MLCCELSLWPRLLMCCRCVRRAHAPHPRRSVWGWGSSGRCVSATSPPPEGQRPAQQQQQQPRQTSSSKPQRAATRVSGLDRAGKGVYCSLPSEGECFVCVTLACVRSPQGVQCMQEVVSELVTWLAGQLLTLAHNTLCTGKQAMPWLPTEPQFQQNECPICLWRPDTGFSHTLRHPISSTIRQSCHV